MRETQRPPAQLFYEGLHFQASFSNKASAEQMATAHGFTVRPYGINIQQISPSTGQAIKWEKCEGYSVWGEKPREWLLY